MNEILTKVLNEERSIKQMYFNKLWFFKYNPIDGKQRWAEKEVAGRVVQCRGSRSNLKKLKSVSPTFKVGTLQGR